jgi:hypothetical protein
MSSGSGGTVIDGSEDGKDEEERGKGEERIISAHFAP